MSSDWNEKFDSKLDKISLRLDNIDKTLAAQAVVLDEHQRRSTALERKLYPVEKHVAMVDGALKLIGILGILASIWLALHQG